MKVGDLVRLSEYGIARDYNRRITIQDPYQLGVITKIVKGYYPYKVHWTKTTAGTGYYSINSHMRRELKYVKQIF